MSDLQQHQVALGDCLDVLRTLPDGAFHSCVTDPPYGINYQSSRRTDKEKRKPIITNDSKPFIWFLYETYRVMCDNSCLICFCEWRHQEVFKVAINTAGFKVKSQMIWDRQWHGMGDLEGSPAPMHDVVWFATKGKFKFPGDRLKSVLRFQRVDAESLVHPTEKPVSLMRHLVHSVTPPGGIVLDPFCGSGSTGKACVYEDFWFYGIERDAEYHKIAEARIAEARRDRAGMLF